MPTAFRDRSEAGRRLAGKLAGYAGRADVVVLALPRGGVPVGFEVARALGAPLDVLVARKLGVPGYEELAMGAVASGGVLVVNDDVVRELDVPPAVIESVAAREVREVARRERAYRRGRREPDVWGKTVILVDDGIATGSTMRAGVAALRHLRPARVIVAVPAAAPASAREFAGLADECVCLITPEPFGAVGLWYESFPQTTDQEVGDLLLRSSGAASAAPHGP